jgi:hypothetical protein
MLHRAVLRHAAALLTCAVTACSGATVPSDRPAPAAADHGPAADPPTGAASPILARPSTDGPPELVVDSVGWQRRDAPVSPDDPDLRHPSTYLQLRYASLDEPALFDMILDGAQPLRDLSLVASGDEACHPTFAAAIARRRPDRMLLRLEGTITAAHVACVAALETDALLLSLCPIEHNIVYDDCDGDEQLALVAASPALRSRVHALAVAFSEPTTWPLLARFPALEYLTIRDEALRNPGPDAIAAVCSHPGLRHLDVFDAQNPGAELVPPWACVKSLQSYAGWRLSFDDEMPLPEPLAPEQPCNLRALLLWSLSDAARSHLQGCRALSSIEVVQP